MPPKYEWRRRELLKPLIYWKMAASACHRIGQHAMASFLRRDYAIRCASAEYYAFVPVAVILLLGFAAGLPLSLLGLLVSHRRELHTPTTKLRMGFLYRHLRNGVEWWDIQGG